MKYLRKVVIGSKYTRKNGTQSDMTKIPNLKFQISKPVHMDKFQISIFKFQIKEISILIMKNLLNILDVVIDTHPMTWSHRMSNKFQS